MSDPKPLSSKDENDILVVTVDEGTVSVPDKAGKSISLEDKRTHTSNAKNTAKISDWPLCNIKEPHKNDVLYGRGGGTNHHQGNKRYRKMVECRKVDYVNSKRLDKPLVALEIIKEWRSQDPPGRFLKMDESTGSWNDVGDKKAREKTSQALREKAPLLRKQQEEEKLGEESFEETGKSTRFNLPDKKKADKRLSRATLLRDHSLGRDYLETDESVGLQGFSWDAGITKEENSLSKSGVEVWRKYPPQVNQAGYPISSYENMKNAPVLIRQQENYHNTSPPRYDTAPHLSSNSWSVDDRNPLVTPVRDRGEDMKWSHRSRSAEGTPNRWDRQVGDVPNRPILHSRSLENDGYGGVDKEHRATYLEKDDYAKCADILGKDSAPHVQDWRHDYHYDEGVSGDCVTGGEWASPSRIPSRRFNHNDGKSSPHSNEYNFGGADRSNKIESSIFKGSSTRTLSRPFENMHRSNAQFEDPSSHTSIERNFISERYRRDQHTSQNNGAWVVSPSEASTPSPRNSNIPKPQPVKRDTSNQNENSETKPKVKKVNRQRSIGYNILSTSLGKVSETDMTSLGNSLEQSTLESDKHMHQYFEYGQTTYVRNNPEKPQQIQTSQRVSTMDLFDLSIETKSSHLDKIQSDAEDRGTGNEKEKMWKANTKLNFDSLVENCKVSLENDNPLVHPPFLSNGDRLSTLGSVDLDLGEDFGNAGRVEAI